MKTVKNVIILSAFFFSLKTQAQTFFTEDFNSYPTGHLNTVYDNTTPGQGGWLVSRDHNNSATGMITAEAGKGNVLTITSNSTTSSSNYYMRQASGLLPALWNNRTPGNNILQFEYELYGVGNFSFGGWLIKPYISGFDHLLRINFLSSQSGNHIIASYFEATHPKQLVLNNYGITPFPQNMWIKVEMFVDYNTSKIHFYIPTLNIQATVPFYHNTIPDSLAFLLGSLSTTSVVKIDNIKVIGLKTLPSYILSTSEQLAAKFNLYPNPATNVVNITNSENMLVNQVTVYDIAGKQLSTQSFNNDAEIHLNVENLSSGTYLLYLQTKEGIAVKKLVKK